MTPRSTADFLGETTSLLCAVLFYGPPVLFFVVPWLLLALMLMGPFTLILTLVAAALAVAAVLAGIAALLVSAFAMLRAPVPAVRPASVLRVSHNPS